MISSSTVKLLSSIILFSAPMLSEAQTGPGGVGNSATNKIWLKAEEGILDPVTNARIGLWADQSGNNFNANQTLPANKPSYQLNTSNGQPYIHFDRTTVPQYFEITAGGIMQLMTYSNTIFIVGKINSGGADGGTNVFSRPSNNGPAGIPFWNSSFRAPRNNNSIDK